MAIEYIAKNKEENLEKDIYPIISKKCNQTFHNIKCNINRANNAMYYECEEERLKLFFTSILMFMPIAFILRNYVSIVVYGIGTIIYAIGGASGSLLLVAENRAVLNTIMISLPLIKYIIEKIKKYFITQTLFKEDSILSGLISLVFTAYLIISCIDSEICSIAESLEFGLDTLFITIITGGFIYLSQAYKKPKEYFVFAFIILLQYTKMPSEILFVFVNIIAIGYGVYKIIVGNRENSYKQIMQGVSVILLLILFRFINSDLDFISKSLMFLITGAIFIISANVMKKKIGGKIDE